MSSPEPTSAVPFAEESRLCLSCGLCCSGTVYSAIPLDADETELAQRAGFKLAPNAEGALEACQPCPQLEGTACRLYGSWRPRACGAYACRLLLAVRAGDMEPDRAVAEVARIKALIARHLPDHANRPLRELVSEAADLTRRGAITPDRAQLVVAVGAVNLEIDRVIRHPDQKTFGRTS